MLDALYKSRKKTGVRRAHGLDLIKAGKQPRKGLRSSERRSYVTGTGRSVCGWLSLERGARQMCFRRFAWNRLLASYSR